MDALDNLHGSIYINIRQGVIVTDIHIGHSGVKQTTSDKNRLKHSIAIIKGTLFLLYYSTLITSGCFCFLYTSTKETIQIRYKKNNNKTQQFIPRSNYCKTFLTYITSIVLKIVVCWKYVLFEHIIISQIYSWGWAQVLVYRSLSPFMKMNK